MAVIKYLKDGMWYALSSYTGLSDTSISTDSAKISILQSQIKELINKKQDTLISGETIKTLNSESILGSGDILVGGGLEQDPENENAGIVIVNTLSKVDKTLTLDNYAADSKVVGEKITIIQTNILLLLTSVRDLLKNNNIDGAISLLDKFILDEGSVE